MRITPVISRLFAATLLACAAALPFNAQAQSLPALTAIPPHNSVTGALTAYTITISATPTTYSISSPTLILNFTITPQLFNQPLPYVNELIEIDTTATGSSALVTVDPQTDCTRSNTGVLTCTKLFTLTGSDLSNPVTSLRVRYYADRFIPNTTSHWIGYSDQSQAVTLFAPPPSTQLCTVETNPMMPTQNGGGTFTFEIPANQVCPTDFWIDPPVAAGYDYTVSGAHFLSVTMPGLQTVNDSSGYLLETLPANFGPGVSLDAGEQHIFPYPVSSFSIKGINPDLALDPTDAAAFATGVKLSSPTGPVTITQTPLVQEFPGTGAQPTGCSAWTQYAFLSGIGAILPQTPATTYSLRAQIKPSVQQALLADLANVRAWRPDTREINIKMFPTYAGDGVDPDPATPSDPLHPGASTATSIFRSATQYMAVDTWSGNQFHTNHWYRIDSKLNVMDYDNEWISPWEDNCLYQTAFVRVDPTGAVDLRVFDDLAGVNGSPL